jgi:hypothetical protein
LETQQEIQQHKNEYDSLKLLKIITKFLFKGNDRQYKYKIKEKAKRSYYRLWQAPKMSCQEYFERVQIIIDVISDDRHLRGELPERAPRGGYTEQELREARERIYDKKVA